MHQQLPDRRVEAEAGGRGHASRVPVPDLGTPPDHPQSERLEAVVADQPQGGAHDRAAAGRGMQAETDFGLPVAAEPQVDGATEPPVPVDLGLNGPQLGAALRPGLRHEPERLVLRIGPGVAAGRSGNRGPPPGLRVVALLHQGGHVVRRVGPQGDPAVGVDQRRYTVGETYVGRSDRHGAIQTATHRPGQLRSAISHGPRVLHRPRPSGQEFAGPRRDHYSWPVNTTVHGCPDVAWAPAEPDADDADAHRPGDPSRVLPRRAGRGPTGADALQERRPR